MKCQKLTYYIENMEAYLYSSEIIECDGDILPPMTLFSDECKNATGWIEYSLLCRY